MSIQLYNTLSGQKEEFEPANPEAVRIYSCGPTVYNYNHLGNFRAYMFIDVLRRHLRERGFGLNHAMNITDVDDKIIANAAEQKKTINEFTAPFTQAFLEDLAFLKVEDVEHRPRATASVPAMIRLMENLEKNSHAYKTDGNLYFRLNSFQEYGKLARLDSQNLRTAADGRFEADEYTKEDVRDFALWKGSAQDETGWESPWGYGRPGWHLECSAMIRDIFGEQGVDIHTGGIDLVFPHHENEIAQSTCAHPGENFVRYWVHNEHLLVEGKKMSKSLGNYFMLRDFSEEERAAALVQDGRAPEFVAEWSRSERMGRAIRYLLLSFHYRTKLNFTFDNLKAADSACERLQKLTQRLLSHAGLDEDKVRANYEGLMNTQSAPGSRGEALADLPAPVGPAARAWLDAMDDDLNTARGLAQIFELVRQLNPQLEAGNLDREVAAGALSFLFAVNQTLDVVRFEELAVADVNDVDVDPQEAAEIAAAIEGRRAARANKDFAEADRIRDELLKRNVRLIDGPEGTTWERVDT